MSNQTSVNKDSEPYASNELKRRARYLALGWTKEYLQREYIEKNRSLQSISEEFDVGMKFLRGALSHYEIVKPMTLRVPKGRKNPKGSEAMKKAHARRTAEEEAAIAAKGWEVRNANRIQSLAAQGITKESLTDLYITQNKSLTELSALFSVGERTVRSWLKLFEIKKTQAQRDAAKFKGFEKLYSDPERVAEIVRKAQTTTRERYGNSWYRVTSSREELAVEAFLKDAFPGLNMSRGDYSVIHKGGHGGALQLDFYFPELSLAIEYNGEYWHDRQLYEEDLLNGTEISRESMKDRLCFEKGITLYHLWSSDWKKRNEETKILIRELIQSRL